MYLQIILNFFGGNKFDTSLTQNDNDTQNYDNSLDQNQSSVTTSSDSSSRETTSYENMLNDIFEQQGSVQTEAKVNADLKIDMQDNIVVGLNESEVSFVQNSDRMILISFVSIVFISVVALIVLISNLTNIIVKLEQKVLNNNISLYHLPFRDIRIENNFQSKNLITVDLNDYYTNIPETANSIEVEIFMTKGDSDAFGVQTFGQDFPSINYWNHQTQISNVNYAWLGLQHENVPTQVSHILGYSDQHGGWKSTNIPIKNNQFNILGYDGGSGNQMSYIIDGGSGNQMSYIIINIKGYRVKHEYD